MSDNWSFKTVSSFTCFTTQRTAEGILGDSNVNAATKGYIENPNFGLRGRENISCWDLMQLLNDAAKQSYIDKFLERNQNCTDFAIGIQKTLNGEDAENYGWFLS